MSMVTGNYSLVKRVLERDEEAFKTLFYVYRNRIFYIAYKMTGSKFDAEDCVQEIFLKMLENLAQYDPSVSSFTTWLVTLSKNYVLDYVRLKRIHEGKCFINSAIVYCKCVDNNFERVVLLSEVENVIGEYDYQILLFKIGFDMTFMEIARLLGISPSKAKRFYYNAYDAAKNYVRERGYEVEDEKDTTTIFTRRF